MTIPMSPRRSLVKRVNASLGDLTLKQLGTIYSLIIAFRQESNWDIQISEQQMILRFNKKKKDIFNSL